MQVTNITDDTLGAYGQTFEPGQTRDLKDNDATRLVADNPRKFKLAPKHRNPKT